MVMTKEAYGPTALQVMACSPKLSFSLCHNVDLLGIPVWVLINLTVTGQCHLPSVFSLTLYLLLIDGFPVQVSTEL